ncbi:adenylate/guanylate cyclase domain-containing protein [Streptomyces kroppenstedtii]|uniref:adenylate/guanylate cyclase domain-containing protein n=1 Tax=Streptomyces kroppenstedtii TaxID=3051181 RepID=UPI0028D3D2B8|nr:adenylate/guanylate cyclase domain-containing protein [Streptomyces sp. DSM 40484]
MRCAACDRAMPSGARFCPSCGVPVGRAGVAAAPAEERKIVTVVFCDLVGSTALSGVLDPETLRTVVLRYFDRMRAPLEECGGTVEKFIGDAVMAVFGVPVTHEDDARRALSAALAMLDAVHDLNENELHPTLGIRLAVRIGVNTGPAVTSTDVSTRQALVAGETVNVAARLEQHAAEGEVLIGPETRRAAGPSARSEPVGPLRLKGKTAPVTAYRLLAVAEDDPRLSRRFDVPLVGRTAELGLLRQALRDVTGGHDAPNVLVVHGEAGMGKTRLVHEWLRDTGPACAQGSGRCRPYGEHGSLAPLADAVREVLRHFPDIRDPAGADEDTDERDEIRQALALLAGGLLEDGTPNPSVDDTCAAAGDLLTALARRRPVVLVVDDCQWASDVLLDVLGTLAADLTASPVLFVCLARPDLLDRRSEWASTGRAARSLSLPGLTAHEAATVAETLMEVGAHGSGAAVAEDTAAGSGVPAHVLEAAGGNPLHLEHLVAAVMEHGSGYRAGGADGLPTTLQALLGARIGALGRAERTTLDLAAVVGREFTADDVAALAERDRDGVPADVLVGAPAGASTGDAAAPSLRGGVEAALVRLRGHRLVDVPDVPDGSGRETPVLRFSSGLLHEVTYHSMAKRARAERHEHLAAQLAARPPDATARDGDRTQDRPGNRTQDRPGNRTEDRTVEASAAMAGHLEHAYRYRTELGLAGPRTEALRRAAAHLLVESGTRALARSDLAWADGLLRRALGLARDGEPDRIPATRGLGEVCLATGRTDEGCSLLRDVLTAPAPHLVETAHARLALSVVSADLAGGTPGEIAHRTMAVFERAGDELGQARAAVRLAQERQFEGRHEAADLLLSRGLEHARRSGAEPERALALGAMGISLWRGPEPVPGATARARTLLAEHGEQRPTVRLTLNCPLAVLFALGERWQDAHTCLTRVRRLVDGLGYAEGAVVLPLFHATVEALAGDGRHALELLDEATAAAHALMADGLLAALHRESARLLLDAGGVDEAVAHLIAATGPGGAGGPDDLGTASPAPASPARSDAADLDGLLARIAVAEGRPADAVTLSERAVRHAVGTDSPVVRAVAWLDRSEVVRRTGGATQARAAAERAVTCFDSKGHLPGARRAAAALDALDATPGRTGGSRPGTAPLPDRTPKGP